MTSSKIETEEAKGPAEATGYAGESQDRIQYLEAKLILKPDRFGSGNDLRDFGKLAHRAAKTLGINFIPNPKIDHPPGLREISFLDTPGFALYNHAFILRRRIGYVDGFPAGDPEIVLKFRHLDEQQAAKIDVRPMIAGSYRIKFKVEQLPLKNGAGGIRLLYSHNCVFGLSQMHDADKSSMGTLVQVFPALAGLRVPSHDKVELVYKGVVEELLLELGQIDFGKGAAANCSIALWRTRGEHQPIAAELGYQIRLNHAATLHEKTRKLSDQFFITLQQEVQEWLLLGTTKTGLVYRLNGNLPQNHE